MSAPQLTRAHLEALLLAHAVLGFDVEAHVKREHLSPAASRLLDGIIEWPEIARAIGVLTAAEPVVDPDARLFVERLAHRVEALSLLELTFFEIDTLVGLVNALPVVGARRARSAA